MILTNEKIIKQTLHWIQSVVINLNLCPFANHEIKRQRFEIEVCHSKNDTEILKSLNEVFNQLNLKKNISNMILVIPEFSSNFLLYLNLIEKAEQLLKKNKYAGIYQLASFHPQYLFEGSHVLDAANYTNRSPYPMIHVLRETAVEHALQHFPHPENIPETNINIIRKLGLKHMKNLLALSIAAF